MAKNNSILNDSSDYAERLLLGCAFRFPDTLADFADRITDQDFRTFTHQLLWRATMHLWTEHKFIDAAAVAQVIKDRGEVDEFDGFNKLTLYLMELLENAIAGSQCELYAQQVREAAILRRLRVTLSEGLHEIDHPTKPVPELVEGIETEVLRLGSDLVGMHDDTRDVSAVVAELWDQLDREKHQAPQGVTSGIAEMDKHITGFRPGEFTIIAARPGVGKTNLAIHLAQHAAIQEQKRVLFVSLEQKSTELIGRMLCGLAEVDSSKIRKRTTIDAEDKRLVAAADLLRESHFRLSDYPNQTMFRIGGRARREARTGLDILFVDYLQLVEPANRKDPRHEQVGQVSRGLKILAGTLNIAIVALAQLNRGPDQRAEQKPRLSDLRESGNLEADADCVMLLSKPDDAPEELTVDVAKNRHGPVGEFTISFNRSTGRIQEKIAETPFHTPFSTNGRF